MGELMRSRRMMVVAVAGAAVASVAYIANDNSAPDADAKKKKRKKRGDATPTRTAIPTSSPDASATATWDLCAALCTPTATAPPNHTPTSTPISQWWNASTIGSGGSGVGQLFEPNGAAFTTDLLTLAVADHGNKRISIWTRTSTSNTNWENTTTFGSEGIKPNQFSVPNCVVFSSDGLTIYVSDGDSRISVWNRPHAGSTSWSNVTTFGEYGSGLGTFHRPDGLALSGDERTLYIADGNGVMIWTRPDTGSTAWEASTMLTASDTNGVALFSDECTLATTKSANQGAIQIWTRPNTSSSTWTAALTLGSGGAGWGQFNTPTGLRVTNDGQRLVIADTGNNRISLWDRPNAASTAWANVANLGTEGSESDQLSNPTDVAMNSAGTVIYAVDKLNNRISIWEPS